jgi:hypothetical protein
VAGIRRVCRCGCGGRSPAGGAAGHHWSASSREDRALRAASIIAVQTDAAGGSVGGCQGGCGREGTRRCRSAGAARVAATAGFNSSTSPESPALLPPSLLLQRRTRRCGLADEACYAGDAGRFSARPCWSCMHSFSNSAYSRSMVRPMPPLFPLLLNM